MSEVFAFLKAEWPEFHEAAAKAASSAHPDPRTACFYARRALELAIEWAFTYDRTLRRPYDDKLSALLHEPTFKRAIGQAVFEKARLIVKLGNEAVHRSRPIQSLEAIGAVRELFHFGYWFARTYARGTRPPPNLTFDPTSLPTSLPTTVSPQTRKQLQDLETRVHERDAEIAALRAKNDTVTAELDRVRAEIAEAKKAAAAVVDVHDYAEDQTRDALIDVLLREAGWRLEEHGIESSR